MNQPIRIGALCVLCASGAAAFAQGPEDFPPLRNAPIPGAPTLGRPTLLVGSTTPLVARQHGLASPAVFDWTGDGKKDLLIGEFETGECYVRVYENVGTNAEPKFTDEFSFAETTAGERMTIDSW